MTETARKIVDIDPESELGRLLEEGDSSSILLDLHGLHYRVVREVPKLNIEFDPARFRAHLEKFAGIWSDIDADELKEYIYRGREEGTRGFDEP